jgi:hypothetical protein
MKKKYMLPEVLFLKLSQNEILIKIAENPNLNPKPLHGKLIEQGFEVNYNTIRRLASTRKNKLIFEDKKNVEDSEVDAFLAAMKNMQLAQQNLDTKQTKAHVTINDDKPVCIAWWGDWHEGAVGTDYDALDRDTDIIAHTDGLYWIGAGDYKDNYQSHGHAGAQYEQIIQPGMQDKAVMHRLKKVAHNNIALVRGCHDDWDKKQSDRDFVESMCDITNSLNLWHGGDIYINLGENQYHFKCRHKYKFESSLNVANAMRRIMEIQGACDIACSAHLHNPYIEQRHMMGEYRTMCRSGSYKILDEYGQKLAGYKGKIGIPCFILFPKEKKVIPLMLEDAINVLKTFR